jgi:hypothetical protein
MTPSEIEPPLAIIGSFVGLHQTYALSGIDISSVLIEKTNGTRTATPDIRDPIGP